MKLKDVISYTQAVNADLGPALQERDVRSFPIDSREVQAGDLFFALSQPDYKNNGFNGDFEDATKYAANALRAGAAACVVRHDRFVEHEAELSEFKDRLLFVDDVIAAFQKLAHGVYLEWNKPVVAITGSAGKTTAKELTAHVLTHGGKKVQKNIKNYNNGLGLPITVLELLKHPEKDIAVLEMGMSTPMHEIARLTEITPPDVAVVLNVLAVHVEHLGSIEAVAAAKAEIVEGMKPGGVAILNADDHRVAAMDALSKGKVITYGIEQKADVSAANIKFNNYGNTTFTLIAGSESAATDFPLNGRHNIMNALAASAVGYSLGMKVADIADALSSVEPPPQRGEILHFAEGFTVIDDSYNSNPAALLSMVKTLIDGGGQASRKIVIAGEMLELGADSAAQHRETGREIARSGIDLLIGVRGMAIELVEGAREAGSHAEFAEDSERAAEMACEIIKTGDVVLVKGSRGVKTEKVIEKLKEKFELLAD